MRCVVQAKFLYPTCTGCIGDCIEGCFFWLWVGVTSFLHVDARETSELCYGTLQHTVRVRVGAWVHQRRLPRSGYPMTKAWISILGRAHALWTSVPESDTSLRQSVDGLNIQQAIAVVQHSRDASQGHQRVRRIMTLPTRTARHANHDSISAWEGDPAKRLGNGI